MIFFYEKIHIQRKVTFSWGRAILFSKAAFENFDSEILGVQKSKTCQSNSSRTSVLPLKSSPSPRNQDGSHGDGFKYVFIDGMSQ
jgi:hypothetical protein